MKCEQFRDALRAARTWNRPDDELPAALRQHADGCVACRDESDRVHRLDAGLTAVARESAINAPHALEGRVLEAFRAHHREVRPVATPSSGSLTWLPMAAGIVLAIGAAGWFAAGQRSVSSPHEQAVAQSVPTPIVPRAPASSPHVAATSRPAPHSKRPAALDEHRTARAATPDASVATSSPGPSAQVDFDHEGVLADFVTLPYGAMPTDDDVHIVEIDVPRDSLYDFGSAAQSGAATNDLVTADVLIGDDGAPRAFRLVEPTATPVALERQQSPLGARSPRP